MSDKYSQNDEERHIVKFFNGFIGKFLDIGAYDGKTFSNTLRLYELGWSGVCVEPSPSIFPNLQEVYKDDDGRMILEQVAIAKESGKLTFWDSRGDAISSLDKKHKEKWESGYKCKFDKIKVDCITMEDLLEKHGYDYDFINLDVEGINIELFRQIPFNKLPKLRMFCVEFDHKAKEIIEAMKKYRFRELTQNGENVILTREL